VKGTFHLAPAHSPPEHTVRGAGEQEQASERLRARVGLRIGAFIAFRRMGKACMQARKQTGIIPASRAKPPSGLLLVRPASRHSHRFGVSKHQLNGDASKREAQAIGPGQGEPHDQEGHLACCLSPRHGGTGTTARHCHPWASAGRRQHSCRSAPVLRLKKFSQVILLAFCSATHETSDSRKARHTKEDPGRGIGVREDKSLVPRRRHRFVAVFAPLLSVRHQITLISAFTTNN